jgi:hypothetical protein
MLLGTSELGEAAAQQSANFVVEVVLPFIVVSWLGYSLAVRDPFNRKRRETGDGPI